MSSLHRSLANAQQCGERTVIVEAVALEKVENAELVRDAR